MYSLKLMDILFDIFRKGVIFSMKKWLTMMFASLFFVLAACGDGDSATEIETIHFADAGWDSIRFHNSVAQTIIENGYGYDTEVTNGTSTATLQALQQGDLNVYMEVWTDNLEEIYTKAIDRGDIVRAATNFDDNTQGLYVPRYVIEGDSERGIEPVAPDLKTVKDLEKYADVFIDPEDTSKGRVVGAPSSWIISEYLDEKLKTYGLDEQYNYLVPGSDSAIVASLAGAVKQGEPWVGCCWSPTWVTASFDLVLLEDEPFDLEKWEEDRSTEFPPNDVVIAVHKDFPTQAEDVYEFLQKYETSNTLTEEALDYMNENDASPEEAAKWWMNEHEDIWTSWVPEDIAEKVKSAIQ